MEFNLQLPKKFNAADHFVDQNIREGRAEKTAVICENRQFTYSQIQGGMNRIGNGLKTLGVRMEYFKKQMRARAGPKYINLRIHFSF